MDELEDGAEGEVGPEATFAGSEMEESIGGELAGEVAGALFDDA